MRASGRHSVAWPHRVGLESRQGLVVEVVEGDWRVRYVDSAGRRGSSTLGEDHGDTEVVYVEKTHLEKVEGMGDPNAHFTLCRYAHCTTVGFAHRFVHFL